MVALHLLYSVMSHMVEAHSPEIGVRNALRSKQSDILQCASAAVCGWLLEDGVVGIAVSFAAAVCRRANCPD